MPITSVYRSNKEYYRAKQRAYYKSHDKYYQQVYKAKRKNDPRVKNLYREARKRHYYKMHRLISYFKNKPCSDCQMFYPSYVMHFDHRNPAEKSFTIGDKVTKALTDILNEVKKCDVVCANCHAERTHKLMLSRKDAHASFRQPPEAWS